MNHEKFTELIFNYNWTDNEVNDLSGFEQEWLTCLHAFAKYLRINAISDFYQLLIFFYKM
jgi:hypothetical protein